MKIENNQLQMTYDDDEYFYQVDIPLDVDSFKKSYCPDSMILKLDNDENPLDIDGITQKKYACVPYFFADKEKHKLLVECLNQASLLLNIPVSAITASLPNHSVILMYYYEPVIAKEAVLELLRAIEVMQVKTNAKAIEIELPPEEEKIIEELSDEVIYEEPNVHEGEFDLGELEDD